MISNNFEYEYIRNYSKLFVFEIILNTNNIGFRLSIEVKSSFGIIVGRWTYCVNQNCLETCENMHGINKSSFLVIHTNSKILSDDLTSLDSRKPILFVFEIISNTNTNKFE